MWTQEIRKNKFDLIIILTAIVLVTALHYGTSTDQHNYHDFYRRLYYFPIIWASLRFGIKGGLAASLLSTALYFPHAFLMPHHLDPQQSIDKGLEIFLYNAMAIVTGWLYERMKKESERHKLTAIELKDSLDRIESIQYKLRVAERLAAIGQLSAGLAHEIRNPLASIQGVAEIVKDDFSPDSPKYEMVNILLEESNRLEKTLNRFLMFARPEEVQLSEIIVEDELNSVSTILENSNAYSEHKIEIDVESGVREITVDAQLLRQVLINLGINALEETPSGGELKFKSYAVKNKGGEFIAIAIKDSGSGIDEKTKERMFNPFFTTKETGTGLGLSIVQKIIENHRGTIEVESSLDGGTKFTICLPARGSI